MPTARNNSLKMDRVTRLREWHVIYPLIDMTPATICGTLQNLPASCTFYTEYEGIRQNDIYSVNCVCITCSSENVTVLVLRQFFIKGFYCAFFKHDTFHCGVSQIIRELILHQILDKYPRISYII